MMIRLRIILVLFITVSALQVFPRSPFNPDSLRKIYQRSVKYEDKADALRNLVEGYLGSDIDTAIMFNDQLLNLSAREKEPEGIIDAMHFRGRIYRIRYLYDSSLYFLDKAIFLADSINDLERMASLLADKGHTLFRDGYIQVALDHYRNSYKIFLELGDSTGMCNALNGLGVLQRKVGNYDTSIYYLLDLVRISEQIGYDKYLGHGLVNLGVSYYEANEPQFAKEYFMRSIPLNERLGILNSVALAHNVIGTIYFDQDSLDQAMSWYMDALEFCERSGDLRMMANVYNNIGNVYVQREDWQQALFYYQKVLDIHKEIESWESYVVSYKNIGLVHERMGDYNKALQIYDSCLSMSLRLGDLKIAIETYFNIYRTYELMEDYRNAFHYLKLHDQLKDSVFNLEKSEKIADLQMKYEKEKDQTRILTLEKAQLEQDRILEKRTNQRNVYMFTGLGIVLMVLFIGLYFRQKVTKDRLIAEQRIQRLEEEKKMLAAKALVEGQEDERKRIARELHDGLGVLLSTVKMQFTTIKDKSPEVKPLIEKASELLEQAAGDVRKISHNMMPGLLTRFGVFEAVGDLMDKVGETEGISVNAEIPEEDKRLPENKEIMIYRIVQELVNNTLKHAGAKNIGLAMQLHKDKLEVVYSDDGKGFNVEEKQESKSIGLQSIQSRVNFMNGKLTIDSAPGKGTRYHVEVPV